MLRVLTGGGATGTGGAGTATAAGGRGAAGPHPHGGAAATVAGRWQQPEHPATAALAARMKPIARRRANMGLILRVEGLRFRVWGEEGPIRSSPETRTPKPS